MALFTELFKEYSFVYLEFKMRQYPDIRVERQETGRKKKKQKNQKKNNNRTLLEISVGVSWEKNFSISYCSSWN